MRAIIALFGRVLLAGQPLLTLKLTGPRRPAWSRRRGVPGGYTRGRDHVTRGRNVSIRLPLRRGDVRGDCECWTLLQSMMLVVVVLLLLLLLLRQVSF